MAVQAVSKATQSVYAGMLALSKQISGGALSCLKIVGAYEEGSALSCPASGELCYRGVNLVFMVQIETRSIRRKTIVRWKWGKTLFDNET
jgi:hypothetical protein